MVEGLPPYVSPIFLLALAGSVGGLIYAVRKASPSSQPAFIVACGLFVWMLTQAILGYTGFYRHFESIPPRMTLALMPPLAVIVALIVLQSGKAVMSLPLHTLTLIHVIRVPVELVFLWLYQNGQVSPLMTFEGRNFDLLSGLTAPIFGWMALRPAVFRKSLIVWNSVAAVLVVNVVVHGVLAMPTPFQLLSFDAPNLAVAFFPFIWLPSVIVPIVLFCHAASLRQLLRMPTYA